jgi:hypothetical protein
MDYDDQNPSRYWNLKDFRPYMEATAGKTSKPAVKPRRFNRSAADTHLPREIRSELLSRGSHPSEWIPITRKESLYGLRSSMQVLLYRKTGKSWRPVKHLTSSLCSNGELIALRHRNTSNERLLRSTGLTKDFSPAKTVKGPVSWEQWRHELDSAVPIRSSKQIPLESLAAVEDHTTIADASAVDPLDVSAEGVDIGPQIDFVDYTKILSGIGVGLVEATLKGIYHAGESVVRPSERLQGIDNIEYADIEGQEVPEKGLAGFSELATAMYEQAKLTSENYREAKAKGEFFEAGKEVSHDPLMQMTSLGDLAVFGALGKVSRAFPNKFDLDMSAGSIRTVNPNYPDFGFTQNCVHCAIATERRFAGNASAVASQTSGPLPISQITDLFGGSFKPVSGMMEISAILSRSGNGARGIVYGADHTRGFGHVWNVRFDKGTTRFLDSQPGNMAGLGVANFDDFTDFQFLLTFPGK